MAENTAESLIMEVRPAYISLPQVPLAQVADSAALSFPHWHLWLGVSASAVSGCSGRP